MILFGIRSPLVVEVEETLHRLGTAITAAISVNDTPRMTDRRAIVDLADFDPPAGGRFIAIAFSPQRRGHRAFGSHPQRQCHHRSDLPDSHRLIARKAAPAIRIWTSEKNGW